jgi:lipopolysaccharide export LptBFGC system permease protein LptF
VVIVRTANEARWDDIAVTQKLTNLMSRRARLWWSLIWVVVLLSAVTVIASFAVQLPPIVRGVSGPVVVFGLCVIFWFPWTRKSGRARR